MVVVMSDLITPCGRTSTGFSRVRHPELGRQQIRSAHVEILEDIVNESTIGGVDEQEARVEGVFGLLSLLNALGAGIHVPLNLCSTANIQIGCLEVQFNTSLI